MASRKISIKKGRPFFVFPKTRPDTSQVPRLIPRSTSFLTTPRIGAVSHVNIALSYTSHEVLVLRYFHHTTPPFTRDPGPKNVSCRKNRSLQNKTKKLHVTSANATFLFLEKKKKRRVSPSVSHTPARHIQLHANMVP